MIYQEQPKRVRHPGSRPVGSRSPAGHFEEHRVRTIATLIVRGGSKRLPRKNVRDFCGLPLMAWTIIQAKCSHLIDEVWISTDDLEMADIGRDFGANVVMRPDWPDADTVSGQRPTMHALKAALEQGPVDCFVGMLATHPLRKPDDLDRIVTAFYQTDAPGVGVMVPRRETVLYEKVGDGIQLSIFDKSYRYYDCLGGSGATDPQWWIDQTEKMVDVTDAVLDAAIVKVAEDRTGPVGPFITFDMWQHADTDTLDEFDVAALKMEHFILKGRGAHVYYEYADPYRGAVGNWRQL